MPFVAPIAAPVFSCVLALSLSIGGSALAASEGGGPVRIEVFTTHDVPIRAHHHADPASGSLAIELYELDGIERVEATLSESLPSDPDDARRAALARRGQVDGLRLDALQRAALGLLKASEYGLDRYPAMVLDGKAVVYGVTDIGEAVRIWRAQSGSVSR